MPAIRTTLSALGLNEKEISVYLALLELGSAQASVVAKRAGIHRSMAQYTCKQLADRGLLQVMRKRNAFHYIAEPPEKLLLLIERQRRKLDQQEGDVRQIVGVLKSLTRPGRSLPQVRFYEGIEGIERLLDDLPLQRKDICTFSAGDYLATKIPNIVSRYRKNSAKNFRSKKIIRAKKYKPLHEGDALQPNVQTRYFMSDDECKVDMQIIDNFVSMVSAERDAPAGIIIDHPDIAEAMRFIFLQSWNQLEDAGSR